MFFISHVGMTFQNINQVVIALKLLKSMANEISGYLIIPNYHIILNFISEIIMKIVTQNHIN